MDRIAFAPLPRPDCRLSDRQAFCPPYPLLSLKPRPPESGAFSRPNMAPNWRRRGAVFSESQIDDFVMPITSAEAVVWHSSPPFLVTGLVQGGLSWEII